MPTVPSAYQFRLLTNEKLLLKRWGFCAQYTPMLGFNGQSGLLRDPDTPRRACTKTHALLRRARLFHFVRNLKDCPNQLQIFIGKLAVFHCSQNKKAPAILAGVFVPGTCLRYALADRLDYFMIQILPRGTYPSPCVPADAGPLVFSICPRLQAGLARSQMKNPPAITEGLVPGTGFEPAHPFERRHLNADGTVGIPVSP
jgi:hypothetical protein